MSDLVLPNPGLELEHLYENAAVGFCVIDAQCRFVRINKAMAAFNGAPVCAHIGREPWEVIPNLDVAQREFIQRTLDGRVPVLNREVRGTTPAQPGVERAWLLSNYPILDDDGKAVGITSVCLEVTEQRRAEEALKAAVGELERRVAERTRELDVANRRLLEELAERKRAEAELRGNRERIRQLLESTHAVPWEADAQTGRFTYVGPQAERLLGYPLAQWYEDEDFWVSTIHPQDRRQALKQYHGLSKTDSEYQFEYRAISSSGDIVWIQDLVTVEWMNGAPTTLRGFMLDITGRKRAEAELRKSEAQARLHREELAHVTRVATMGELAASLAHELNQPLTAIVANAQAARRWAGGERPDLEELKSVLNDVVDDGKRAGEVIRRMRSLVSKGEPLRSPLRVEDLLSQVLKLVHQDAIERHIRVERRISTPLPMVHGDEIQLQQVVLNLVLNGFDAMASTDAASRSLTVGAEANGSDGVTITVSDTGCGIPTGNAERIFEPFFTSKPGGMGMGLSINRSIVNAHHGQMWASDRPGGGTTFHVALPAADASLGDG